MAKFLNLEGKVVDLVPAIAHAPRGRLIKWEKWNAWPMFLVQCPRCGSSAWTARDSGAADCESCGRAYQMPSLPSRYETGMDPDERFAAEHDVEELAERLAREIAG